jgi:hypothetical protein
MPVTVKKVGNRYRVVEADTGNIVKNKAGTAVDGSGHGTKAAAMQQAKAINASLGKRGRI